MGPVEVHEEEDHTEKAAMPDPISEPQDPKEVTTSPTYYLSFLWMKNTSYPPFWTIMKIPWRSNGNPLQCSCQGNPMGRGAWWATVRGVVRVRHDFATKLWQDRSKYHPISHLPKMSEYTMFYFLPFLFLIGVSFTITLRHKLETCDVANLELYVSSNSSLYKQRRIIVLEPHISYQVSEDSNASENYKIV